MEIEFHLRVRALIFRDGKFLLVKGVNGGNVFLVGGHVESGEGLEDALRREIFEECGRQSEVKGYVGAIENSWFDGNVKHWEVVHIFHVELSGHAASPDVESREPHLGFFWAAPGEFEKINLLPVVQRKLMENWASGDGSVWWASSLE